jgi:rubrerythrin
MPTLRTILFTILAILLAASLEPSIYSADGPNTDTLQQLQNAYSMQLGAFERNRAFAMKADEENFPGAALLFRAVARSAQIQYTNLIDAIRMMGFAPEATVETPFIESTKDNLQTALNKAEALEKDNSYSVYIKRAKTEGSPYGAKVLDNLRQQESQNVRLFKAALKNFDQLRRPVPGYYVCAASGYVSAAIDAAHCIGSDWDLEK